MKLFARFKVCGGPWGRQSYKQTTYDTQQWRNGDCDEDNDASRLGSRLLRFRRNGNSKHAFEKAWAFVEFDPMLGVLEASEKQSQLARCLMALLKQGETDPTPLANSGIKMLRRNRQSEVRKQRTQTSSAKALDASRVIPYGRA